MCKERKQHRKYARGSFCLKLKEKSVQWLNSGMQQGKAKKQLRRWPIDLFLIRGAIVGEIFVRYLFVFTNGDFLPAFSSVVESVADHELFNHLNETDYLSFYSREMLVREEFQ